MIVNNISITLQNISSNNILFIMSVFLVLGIMYLLYLMTLRRSKKKEKVISEEPFYKVSDVLLQDKNMGADYDRKSSIPVNNKPSFFTIIVIGILVFLMVMTPFFVYL